MVVYMFRDFSLSDGDGQRGLFTPVLPHGPRRTAKVNVLLGR